MSVSPVKVHEPLFSLVTLISICCIVASVYLLFLVALRTLVFERYPVSSGFFGIAAGYMSMQEEDCTFSGIQWATEEEAEAEKKRQARCLQGVKEQRRHQQISDVLSPLFLLATGLLLYKQRYMLSKQPE
jgi:hypothetical protein